MAQHDEDDDLVNLDQVAGLEACSDDLDAFLTTSPEQSRFDESWVDEPANDILANDVESDEDEDDEVFFGAPTLQEACVAIFNRESAAQPVAESKLGQLIELAGNSGVAEEEEEEEVFFSHAFTAKECSARFRALEQDKATALGQNHVVMQAATIAPAPAVVVVAAAAAAAVPVVLPPVPTAAAPTKLPPPKLSGLPISRMQQPSTSRATFRSPVGPARFVADFVNKGAAPPPPKPLIFSASDDCAPMPCATSALPAKSAIPAAKPAAGASGKRLSSGSTVRDKENVARTVISRGKLARN